MAPCELSQAVLNEAKQFAFLIGAMAFVLAMLFGGLIYTISHLPEYKKPNWLKSFCGDLAVSSSLAIPVFVASYIYLSFGQKHVYRMFIGCAVSLLIAMIGGWAVLALSRRAKKNTVLMLRILIAAVCAFIMVLHGIAFDTIKMPFTTTFVNLGFLAVPITTFWMTLIIVAFQMTARVWCLSLGIGALSSLTLAFAALMLPQRTSQVSVVLSGTTFGACLGMLPWAMIAGQDFITFAASSSIGVLTSAISVSGALKNTAMLLVVVPMLVLGIPVVEATCALCEVASGKQLKRRISLFELLASEGLAERRLWFVLILANSYLCLIAIALVALVQIYFILKLIILASLASFAVMLVYVSTRLLSQKSRPRETFIELLGIPISTLDWDETLKHIEQLISSGRPNIIVTADTSALVRAQEDDEFKHILKNASLVTPDGIGVVIAARLLGYSLAQRICGVELMDKLCAMAAANGYRVFLLGAKEGVAELAAKRLSEKHRGLKIIGTHHGYFSEAEEEKVVQLIRQSKPHILFVAMGIPKQEKWIAKHLHDLNVPVCIGVGGSFDVYAGVVKRAPRWVQHICMEWLYRAIKEPHRFKRLIAIPKLLLWVARSVVRAMR